MTDISHIQSPQPTPRHLGAQHTARDASGQTPAAPSRSNGQVDTLDLSNSALERLRGEKTPESATIRSELVDRIRSEIAAGSYLTPERLDQAADKLAQDISNQEV